MRSYAYSRSAAFSPLPGQGSLWTDGYQFDYEPETDCLDLELKMAVYGDPKPSYSYPRETLEVLGKYFSLEKRRPGWMKTNIFTKSVFYWRAQLRHYGLPTAQKKELCKERIQDGLRAGTLQVPDHLVRLERELKETFLTEPRFENNRRYEPVQKDSFFGTSVEKRENFQRLLFYLYNNEHPDAIEKNLVYWKAQLIHDGMRPTQPKALCKGQLLNAAQLGTLQIPQNLVELEAKLKAEYEEKRLAEMTPAERALEERKAVSTNLVQEAANLARAKEKDDY